MATEEVYKSPRHLVRWLYEGQDQGQRTHDDNLKLWDIVLQSTILDRNLTSPPLGTPSPGDTYQVAGVSGTAGGVWAGHEKELAYWYSYTSVGGVTSEEWRFWTPFEGHTAWIADTNVLLAHDGTNYNDQIYP